MLFPERKIKAILIQPQYSLKLFEILSRKFALKDSSIEEKKPFKSFCNQLFSLTQLRCVTHLYRIPLFYFLHRNKTAFSYALVRVDPNHW